MPGAASGRRRHRWPAESSRTQRTQDPADWPRKGRARWRPRWRSATSVSATGPPSRSGYASATSPRRARTLRVSSSPSRGIVKRRGCDLMRISTDAASSSGGLSEELLPSAIGENHFRRLRPLPSELKTVRNRLSRDWFSDAAPLLVSRPLIKDSELSVAPSSSCWVWFLLPTGRICWPAPRLTPSAQIQDRQPGRAPRHGVDNAD